ncbi:PREDICTED: E3 ubiquitin-protein ligase At1g63170-like isoform X2 [Nelumbo nucifera]|uniref:RING-type E3 ubiquitin transferase n=1 Tax=Nelumbo nucifera TaxID=4432 RepID=A0A1U7ZMZ6_NELNU|nr:PREDICTED: E3 ubiquitin-protein ligase At1g63170-like isoform X2 [Nelumbo nucifera]
MATTRSSNSNPGEAIDSTPLLGNAAGIRDEDRSRRAGRRPSLRGAARFLRRASSRRMMREPSMLVRETAAEQLEERQSDWAYSRPVVILDIIWNMAFVIVAVSVLILSRNESPSMPLRLWIVGYAVQCILHMVCVCVEYRRRHSSQSSEEGGNGSNGNLSSSSRDDEEDAGDYTTEIRQDEDGTSVAKHLESANTMFSFIWWIIGFYWVSAGGQALTRDSPELYWLCIIFLAFDVFFVVFCVALACVIGIAVCCCLPCIIAVLYAVADQALIVHGLMYSVLFLLQYNTKLGLPPSSKEDHCSLSSHRMETLINGGDWAPFHKTTASSSIAAIEGASKEDIDQLPKYKFRRISDFEKISGEIQGPFGGIMTECDTETPIEHVLSLEDAECCICLSTYDDGAELRELPCGHHFHCACIDKWLYINATCPLCKYNIIKSGSQGREEV